MISSDVFRLLSTQSIHSLGNCSPKPKYTIERQSWRSGQNGGSYTIKAGWQTVIVKVSFAKPEYVLVIFARGYTGACQHHRWCLRGFRRFPFCVYFHINNDQMYTEFMMTSSNGNIFRVTGPLCAEFTGPGEFPTQRPVPRSFDVFFDLRLNKRLSKQPWGWWFETLPWSLWRHCNVIWYFRHDHFSPQRINKTSLLG